MDGTTDIAYEGRPLEPGRAYHWKARAWDEEGRPGPWSSTATFETALDPRTGWDGCSWIGLGRGGEPFGVPSGNRPSTPWP